MKHEEGMQGVDCPKTITGKELIEMGYRRDDNGYLIMSSATYSFQLLGFREYYIVRQ